MRSDRTYCSRACASVGSGKRRRIQNEWETIVVFGDVHVPFQDDTAVNLVFEFIEREFPDTIVINGDFADCYNISNFDKDPERGVRFKDEVAEVRSWLEKLRNVSRNADIIYVSGNHEHRLTRYLNTEARQLKGIEGLSIPEQFHFDELGIQWIDCVADRFTDTYVRIGDLLIGHFAKISVHSGYTAKNLLDQYGMSLIQAHVHSMGSSNKNLESGAIMAWEGGCLCDLNPHYCKQKKWMHGFHVVHKRKDGDFFHVEPVMILDGKYFYGGNVYYPEG